MKTITEVVAALIWDGDKFMICQRPAHKARGLLWEFVGGKVEPGESKEIALIRECREELGIELSVDTVFMEVLHEYPDLTVHLALFNATIAAGVPKKLEHNDIQWITPSQIPDFEFCPADVEILKRIQKECMTMTALQTVYEFLHGKTFYIASCEGDQPRVRPFGIVHIFEDKLYIHTGRSKKCYQQFVEQKVEICCMDGGKWIRLSGTLHDDERLEAEESMAAANPEFYKNGPYKVGDGNNCVMYFSDAKAVISGFGIPNEVLEF